MTAPLKGIQLQSYLQHLPDGWTLFEEERIEKSYSFKNFSQALDFVNLLGAIAEREGHHPDLFLSWGRVKVSFCTHKIHGLSENDFIMADLSEQLRKSYEESLRSRS